MARKHHKPEEIVAKLRQVEVLVGQDKRKRCGDRPLALPLGMHAAQRFSVR